MAERMGFEPMKGFPFTRFPSVRLQPLGHLSKEMYIIVKLEIHYTCFYFVTNTEENYHPD